MAGAYKKLTIESFEDPKYGGSAVDTFTTEMFNPENYKEQCEIDYQKEQGIGTTGLAQRFKKIKPACFSMEFMLDGTIPIKPHDTVGSEEKLDVQEAIDQFKKVVAKYHGSKHRTAYLKISWGSLIFKCVLKTFKINMCYFDSDGTPLRAVISASFCHHVDDEGRVEGDGSSSPDLTHVRIVKDGDTLPLMTYSIYGDASLYMEVARANNLADFRNLQPGQKLKFPPIAIA